ncbi:MAG: aminotransferase class IV [Candidatus Omnitrophica bacterium]|nr:aminotransferase class IV [Candidatus Omnitrophota bacterium]
MPPKVYLNGHEVSPTQGLELLQDEAVGIFETMRVWNGKILHEEDHLQRLLESARTVGYRPLPELLKIRGEVRKALRASGEQNTSARVTLCGGKTFVILGARGVPKALYKTGVQLRTASFPRGGDNAFPYQVKAAAYQQAVLATAGSDPGEVFDWLFLDRGGLLTETRVGNFFLVTYAGPDRCPSSKVLLRTPSESLILNGVVRRFVIKCAREMGYRVLEAPLSRHDFFNADEAFLTNTSWEILPVRALDGRMIGVKVPGPVTRKIHSFYRRRI